MPFSVHEKLPPKPIVYTHWFWNCQCPSPHHLHRKNEYYCEACGARLEDTPGEITIVPMIDVLTHVNLTPIEYVRLGMELIETGFYQITKGG